MSGVHRSSGASQTKTLSPGTATGETSARHPRSDVDRRDEFDERCFLAAALAIRPAAYATNTGLSSTRPRSNNGSNYDNFRRGERTFRRRILDFNTWRNKYSESLARIYDEICRAVGSSADIDYNDFIDFAFEHSSKV